MDRGGGPPAVRDRIDQIARTLGDVASGPDPRMRRLQGFGIDSQPALARLLHLDVAQKAQIGALADGKDHGVGRKHFFCARNERRGEPTVGVEDGLHRDRLEPRDPRLADESVRAAPVDDRDALALGLGDLLRVGRNLVGRLERDDGDVAHAGPDGGPGDVEGRRHRATRVVVRLAPATGDGVGTVPGAAPAARSAVRAASNATLPPPTTTTRSPRSTLNA